MLFMLNIFFGVEAIYFSVRKVLHTTLGVANGQMPHAVASADTNFSDIPW